MENRRNERFLEMMAMKRNEGLHTPVTESRLNVLRFLSLHARTGRDCAPKSAVGRAAFPDYDFKAPQGAAFAVAKLARDLENEGLVSSHHDDFCRGLYITSRGLSHLNALAAL
jgi:hypothetical protein